MGQRVATFVICDNCGKEEIFNSVISNDKNLKRVAKTLGFVTTTNHVFCDERCERIFKSK